MKKPFKITSICRADLEGVGYDTKDIDDATMEYLASKMADGYVNEYFWGDLKILADNLDIPKKK